MESGQFKKDLQLQTILSMATQTRNLRRMASWRKIHLQSQRRTILTLTSFSESPRHLLTMLDAEMLKKVVLHSVATALASNVLPVPNDAIKKNLIKKYTKYDDNKDNYE